MKTGTYSFRNFKVEIKERPIPQSYLIIFSGGSDVDSGGWESASGDRKRFEEDLKFMWNPFDAPSNRKGEYMVKFSSEEKLNKFADWIDKQIREYDGVEDR